MEFLAEYSNLLPRGACRSHPIVEGNVLPKEPIFVVRERGGTGFTEDTWGPWISFRVGLRPQDVIFKAESPVRARVQCGWLDFNEWDLGEVR